MPKNPLTRLDDTVEFIRSATVPEFFRPTQLLLVTALKAELAAINPVKQTYISTLMSQVSAENRPDDPQERNYRRAAILLHAIFSETKHLNTDRKAINANDQRTPAEGFRTALVSACDKYFTRYDVAASNFNLLRTNPTHFLQSFQVSVNSGPTNDQDVSDYEVEMMNGLYKLRAAGSGANLYKFSALNVKAQLYKDLVDKKKIKATNSSSDPSRTLMLTTQFSGCTFCYQEEGGNLLAAHIDPRSSTSAAATSVFIDGVTMAKNLQASGGFEGATGSEFKTLGRSDDGAGVSACYGTGSKAIVVAVKRTNDWTIFVQRQTGSYSSDVIRIDNA